MKKTLLIISLFLFASSGYAQLADSIRKIINTLNLSKDNYVFKKCFLVKTTDGKTFKEISVRTNRIMKAIVIGVSHPEIHTILIFTETFQNGGNDPTTFRKIQIMLEDKTVNVRRRQMQADLINQIDAIVQKH